MQMRLSESKMQNIPAIINYDLQQPIFEDSSNGSEVYPLLRSDSEGDSKIMKPAVADQT